MRSLWNAATPCPQGVTSSSTKIEAPAAELCSSSLRKFSTHLPHHWLLPCLFDPNRSLHIEVHEKYQDVGVQSSVMGRIHQHGMHVHSAQNYTPGPHTHWSAAVSKAPLPLLQHRVSTLWQPWLSWPDSSCKPQVAPTQCPPQPLLPQGRPHLTMQVIPEAVCLFGNSSLFSEKKRGQPDPVARPADQCRWAGNQTGVAQGFPAESSSQPPHIGVGKPVPVCWQSPTKVGE